MHKTKRRLRAGSLEVMRVADIDSGRAGRIQAKFANGRRTGWLDRCIPFGGLSSALFSLQDDIAQPVIGDLVVVCRAADLWLGPVIYPDAEEARQ